jgi:SAM-dependent methyltransferase
MQTMNGCAHMALFSRFFNFYERYRFEKRYKIQKHLQTINHLYANVNGFHISKSARIEDDLALTYGEIDLLSFLALLSLTSPKPHWHFYELGCGVGKTVIAASLCYQFQKSIGIDCLKPLVDTAKERNVFPNIDFVIADLQDLSYQDANLIFINIASFVPEVWHNLNLKLQHYHDVIIITCAKPLAQSVIMHQTLVECSWGIIPAYIQYFPKKD